MKKRLEYIDAVKGLSILMIMLGHITSLDNPVDTWMSSCKLCIFYVISGFLMAHSKSLQKRTAGQFVKNLLCTLAWPYLVFSLLAILAKTFFTFSKHPEPGAVYETFRTNMEFFVFLKGINSMWFLPTVFFGELIILALYKLPKVFAPIYAALGLFGLSLASVLKEMSQGMIGDEKLAECIGFTIDMLGKSIFAAWFLGFGYCVYLLMNKASCLENHFMAKLVIGGVLTVSNIYFSLKNQDVDLNQMSMGDRPLLFIFGGTAGSLGLILLMDAISQKMSVEWLSYWGRNSLVLMCVHTALGFRKIAYEGWKKTAFIPEEAGLEYIIECLLVLVVLCMMMYCAIEITNKHFRYLLKWDRRKRTEPEAA